MTKTSKKELEEKNARLESACHVRDVILGDIMTGVQPARYEKTIALLNENRAEKLTLTADVYRGYGAHGGFVAVTETTHYLGGDTSSSHSFYYLLDWVAKCTNLCGIGGKYYLIHSFAQHVLLDTERVRALGYRNTRVDTKQEAA